MPETKNVEDSKDLNSKNIHKYNEYFDDSSSDEDVNKLDNNGIEAFESKSELIIESNEIEDKLLKDNLRLSFFVHEVGVRLLNDLEEYYSPSDEDRDHYSYISPSSSMSSSEAIAVYLPAKQK